MSQIFAQQLPLLTARPGSPHATGGAHAAPTVAEAMPSGHSAPMAVVSLLDETIAGPSSNSPNTPAPPGIEVDHRLAQLPTPPPPRHLTGLLPAAADLPPPLPPERQLDSKYTPLLHDFGGLASGALYAMANG
ncbi:MAG: hypothetical protein H7123_06335, partial [Thermoleophilia bacterium]|nr:hypothetical protein [Thermoleophilia bacterium]